MNTNPISIGGIEIPSDSPLFLTLIAIHVFCALVCVVAGLIAMLADKRPGRHPKAGKVYYYFLSVVFISVIIISFLRWSEDYPLLILGTLSFGLASVGRKALIAKWRKWPVYHVTCMGLSYIILLTAFYVDNGKFLPVWRNLPHIVYWTLPTIIGIPIIIYVLMRHPVVKNMGK